VPSSSVVRATLWPLPLDEDVARGRQPKVARGKIADPVAIHRQLDRSGRGHDVPPFALERGEHVGVDRLDLGDDMIGAMLFDRAPQRRPVEHREDFARVGELHRGSIVVAVAGDHPASEPLGGNRHFAPQFARSEQHDGGEIHGAALSVFARRREPRLDPRLRGGTRNARRRLCAT